jgi:hypothetical protein
VLVEDEEASGLSDYGGKGDESDASDEESYESYSASPEDEYNPAAFAGRVWSDHVLPAE